MNSVERVFAALRLEQPDRVPIVEFLIDPKVAAVSVPGFKDSSDCMYRQGWDGLAFRAVVLRDQEHRHRPHQECWGGP